MFRRLSFAAALSSFVIVATTGVLLAVDAQPAFKSSGFVDFFTHSVWNASIGKFGVFGLLVGTVLIATIACCVAVPLGVGLAVFVNEYAPDRIRRALTSVVDLLAAIPSVVFALWGFWALQGPLVGGALFIANHLNVIPLFRSGRTDILTGSAFMGGVVAGFTILPTVTSISRDVMAQCPREQCEGALGLGKTRWEMVRMVILPFSRPGIIGAVLLGFGRALGETIVITLMVQLVFDVNTRVLTQGGGSIAELIAVKFGDARGVESNALIGAGLGLFVVTLVVNMGARGVLTRTRRFA